MARARAQFVLGAWAPGNYSTLFEDPDRIRIEALFIPGTGNLDRIEDGPLTSRD